ncbi:hypothetical protein [Streptobacillus moniliformis]|uniref:hypothetical protein n=1 Tax=Streptobacillus moniliformis TaxID=34105 RepID=UPI0007E336F9|nr:hypothetical protein [Streptobacillus moniliformis]
MKKFIRKIDTKLYILLGVLFFSSLALADTSQVSVAGFEKPATYLTNFLRFIKYFAYVVSSIYFIIKMIEFAFNTQWDQFGKSVLTYVLIMGAIWGVDKIVRAVGGTTINSKTEKVKIVDIEKLKFLGEHDERK